VLSCVVCVNRYFQQVQGLSVEVVPTACAQLKRSPSGGTLVVVHASHEVKLV
jgi:hypothetical protein